MTSVNFLIIMMNNLAFSIVFLLYIQGRHIAKVNSLNVLSHSRIKNIEKISNNLAATVQMSADETSVRQVTIRL